MRTNGLVAFADFWNFPGTAVDAPNVARGGWSHVAKHELKLPSGGIATLYTKRQLHYQTKSWRHPFVGEPTLKREFHNLKKCRDHGVPTASMVYFATAKVEGKPAAILITEALTGFAPLDVYLQSLPPDAALARGAVLLAVARVIAHLHASGLKHGCFYPKHILVPTNGIGQLHLLDFEKARPFLLRHRAMRRDFGTLFRRLPMCSREDFEVFRREYCVRTQKRWCPISQPLPSSWTARELHL
ncbi:MAG TPA: lipopolysaccharide kinase InaA family protein [Candidatus Acidoferrum sp.]|nr:lipopolysaccharide kinase InaA family protein [Candidatus Acidoferrum sp.]